MDNNGSVAFTDYCYYSKLLLLLLLLPEIYHNDDNEDLYSTIQN